MNRNTIIESAYETISESLEWGVDTDIALKHPESFPNFVDGIVAATDKLLEKLEEENKNRIEALKSCEEYLRTDTLDALDTSIEKMY